MLLKSMVIFLTGMTAFAQCCYSATFARNSVTVAAASSIAVHFIPYAVSYIGRRGVPRLSSKQIKWIAKIEKTPYYASRISELWFVQIPSISTPVIVFDGGSVITSHDLQGRHPTSAAFWVIGDPCNAFFDVYQGEVSTTQDWEGCSDGKEAVGVPK